MHYYLTTDEMIERILTTIATGSKVQVVGTSESLRDVDPVVTRLLRAGQGRDAGCMFWDGTPADVTVRVDDGQPGDPRLTIIMEGVGFMRRNAVYEEVLWAIASNDRPERDAIRSKLLYAHVPPALAAMSVDGLAKMIFNAVKKAVTGY